MADRGSRGLLGGPHSASPRSMYWHRSTRASAELFVIRLPSRRWTHSVRQRRSMEAPIPRWNPVSSGELAAAIATPVSRWRNSKRPRTSPTTTHSQPAQRETRWRIVRNLFYNRGGFVVVRMTSRARGCTIEASRFRRPDRQCWWPPSAAFPPRNRSASFGGQATLRAVRRSVAMRLTRGSRAGRSGRAGRPGSGIEVQSTSSSITRIPELDQTGCDGAGQRQKLGAASVSFYASQRRQADARIVCTE